MRYILAIVPGIKVTGMSVYRENPPLIKADGAPMDWVIRLMVTSRRPRGTPAKKAIEIHVAKATQVLVDIYPKVTELWIEGSLDKSTGKTSLAKKSERQKVALVGGLLSLPVALKLRTKKLSTVLVEPGEWRKWAFQEGGRGTLKDNLGELFGRTVGHAVPEQAVHAMALGRYAGSFSEKTSTKPRSAELYDGTCE
jgi:hypothetical protein